MFKQSQKIILTQKTNARRMKKTLNGNETKPRLDTYTASKELSTSVTAMCWVSPENLFLHDFHAFIYRKVYFKG